MKVAIIDLGSSKGICIPDSVLSECNAGSAFDLRVEGNNIVLVPVVDSCFEEPGIDRRIIDEALDLGDTLVLGDSLVADEAKALEDAFAIDDCLSLDRPGRD
jgi:antitoxin component of MazEF toxin-antitoxin module